MLVYCFDDNKRFAYTDIVKDGAPVPANATTVEPLNSDGSAMYAPTWNGTAWVSMTREEFEKEFENTENRPENVPDPDKEDEREAQQMIAFAKLQADVDALKKGRKEDAALLATLMKQQAIKAKEGN